MTDRDALLRAICENPADDAPRLIYADWLDEHGDPRQAEFIRVQIELARLTPSEQTSSTLVRRQVELWKEMKRWRYARRDWPALELGGFRRGFHRRWSGTAAEYLQIMTEYWRIGPVDELLISFSKPEHACRDRANEAAASPWLASVSSVALMEECVPDEWVEAFARSPHASRWARVDLSGLHSLAEATCRVLASSPLATSGGELLISTKSISDKGRAMISEAFGERVYITRIEEDWSDV